jgi:aminopeptidase
MADQRIENFAKLLVRYSIYAQKGETIGVEGPDTTAPLMEAVYEELLRAGAFPVIRMSPVSLTEIFMKTGQDLHFDQLPKFERAYAKGVDGTIRVMGSNNTRALSGTDPTRMARFAKTRKPVRKIILAKKWALTLFPTEAYAQDAEMSLRDFEDVCDQGEFSRSQRPGGRMEQTREGASETDRSFKRRG